MGLGLGLGLGLVEVSQKDFKGIFGDIQNIIDTSSHAEIEKKNSFGNFACI